VSTGSSVNLRTRDDWKTRLTLLFAHCLQVEQSRNGESVWQATCFRAIARNMPNADTQNAQWPDVADDQSAARELQKVLSLRLPSFYRCALRLLGNRADAEDAVQEALLAAYKHLHQFRGQSQMSTWLTTIVGNCARMQLRKRPRQIHVPLDEQGGEDQRYFVCESLADRGPSPEDECRSSELAAHLRKCTALLSPSLRRTFQLRVVDGLSIFETAQLLGLPHGTVKAQLARARRNLARYMKRTLEPRSRRAQRLYKKVDLLDRGNFAERHLGSSNTSDN
jgi:RNA polymerase sigma-70 factor, ECF subfamily